MAVPVKRMFFGGQATRASEMNVWNERIAMSL